MSVKKIKRTLAEECPEIAAQWHPTKNGDLTPDKVTSKSSKKVWWLYPYDDPVTGKHFDFEWQAIISNRTKGDGCPYLSGQLVWSGFNDLATHYPEIAKEWHPTKNGNLTPDKVAPRSGKKVWWLYPYDDLVTGKHFDFEWQAAISSRTNGVGCPYLSGKLVYSGFNDLQSLYPEIAKEWHPTKNGDLTPDKVTPRSGKKVWWLYPYDDPVTGKHFDFEWNTSIVDRTNGNRCPYLSGQLVWSGFNDLATHYPEIAKEWHPTKNGDLTPDKVGVKSDKKIWWLYPYDDPITGKHFDFEWKAAIGNRTKGDECPYLSGQKVWSGFNDLATHYPEIAKEWHPTKNGDLTPDKVTPKSNKKVWWFLPYDDPITGQHFDFEWKAVISSRVLGIGCPYLNGKLVYPGYNDFATHYPELVIQWHWEKNGKLTPNQITATSNRKVWWLCEECGHSWRAIVSNRARLGHGCPKCAGKIK